MFSLLTDKTDFPPKKKFLVLTQKTIFQNISYTGLKNNQFSKQKNFSYLSQNLIFRTRKFCQIGLKKLPILEVYFRAVHNYKKAIFLISCFFYSQPAFAVHLRENLISFTPILSTLISLMSLFVAFPYIGNIYLKNLQKLLNI